jgi:dTDP-glucose 4,6-dehydratase
VRDRVEITAGDVRDFESVVRAVDGCDVVFHLAALVGIPWSYESPLAYVRTNVEGTYNVLEAARRAACRDVVVTSTSETYGTARTELIDEDHPKVGQSPYAATKIAADELARSYHLSFGVPVKIVRPFNAYGPRQSARAFIPTVIAQILGGAREIALGSLEPTRDLTFVADTARAFVAVQRCAELVGQAVNVAQGRETSVGEVVERIQRIAGTSLPVVRDAARVRPDASEVMRLCGSNARLVAATGWQPSHDLDAGLSATIEWMRRNLQLYRPGRYAT